jgi:Kef-type K+ transport system membrane component KefB
LAVVFGLMGVILIVSMRARSGSIVTQAVSSVAGVALIGPSIWYFYAASQIRKLRGWVVPVSIKVVIGQGLVVLVCLLLRPALSRGSEQVLFPVLMTIFFLPALIVMAWQLSKSLDLIRAIDPSGAAFQVSGVSQSKAPSSDDTVPFAKVAHPADEQDIPFAKLAKPVDTKVQSAVKETRTK